MYAGSDQLPAVAVQGESVDPGAAGGELGGRSGHRPLDGAVVVRSLVLMIELIAQPVEAIPGRRSEALAQPVESLDQDLGVAMRAEQPGDVAVVPVLTAPDVVAQRVTDEAEGGADLLHVLARLVDRVGRFGPGLAAELGDRVVNLDGDHSLHPRTERLPVDDPIGGRIGRAIA